MNYPDIITISGMIIVLYSLFTYYQTNSIIYIILALIGFSCDYFDGYIARKYNMTSEFGNVLDKFVDKVNQMGIHILLMAMYNVSPIYIIIYLIREIIMYMMRKNKMKPKTSSIYGKLKTSLYPILLILYHFDIYFKEEYLQLLTTFNMMTLIL
jgi:CDP-diacylglycerol--glycerol-3-phosphate 3-phosphatidyltransferase